jgi:hypothetical protein
MHSSKGRQIKLTMDERQLVIHKNSKHILKKKFKSPENIPG